jgi:hypothetical protein
MSGEPISIGDNDAEPLYLGWYAGPLRTDGGVNARVCLSRGSETVNLSVDELKRLVLMAGIVTYTPTPYAVPEEEDKHDDFCTCTDVCAPWRKPRDHIVNETRYGVGGVA